MLYLRILAVIWHSIFDALIFEVLIIDAYFDRYLMNNTTIVGLQFPQL